MKGSLRSPQKGKVPKFPVSSGRDQVVDISVSRM